MLSPLITEVTDNLCAGVHVCIYAVPVLLGAKVDKLFGKDEDFDSEGDKPVIGTTVLQPLGNAHE